MELTRKQEEALKIAVQRYKDGEKYTCIAGFAGSGKSTTIKYIIEALGIDPVKYVAFCCYTGKACSVLAKKGNPNCVTAHHLLYKSIMQDDGSFIHVPREELEKPYKIIVVDEVSMIPKEIWELILSHKVYVLACGDPGQLPPIGESCHVLDHPHIFLDEIVRQAAESQIIRLSMDIRAGKPLQLQSTSELSVISKDQLEVEMLKDADQILLGKNVTRYGFNRYIRKKIYNIEGEEPVEGDKVICVKNYWDKMSAVGDVCINGSIGIINGLRTRNTKKLHPQLIANFLPEYYSIEQALTQKPAPYFKNLNIDHQLLTTGVPTINEKNFMSFDKQERPMEFEYAYTITVHKAQGSEWDKLLVLEEHLGGDHIKWLYTAVTRAAKQLIIVKDASR